jgi:hypothetical protein
MPLWLIGGERGTIAVYSNQVKIRLSNEKTPRIETFRPVLKDGFERIYQSFAESFYDNRPLVVPYSEVLETMKLIDKIQGQGAMSRVTLKEEQNGDPLFDTA